MGPITPDSATLLYMQPSFAAWPIIVLPFVAAKAKVCFGKRSRRRRSWNPASASASRKAPLVPTMWRMVFEAGPENYDLSALTLVSISGEAPAPSDVRQLYDRICKNICCVYLSGEAFTASGVMANTRDLMERGKIGSSGRPVVGGDVRILVPGGGFDDEAAERRDRRDRDLGPVARDRLLEGSGADAAKNSATAGGAAAISGGWMPTIISGSPAASTTSSTPAASRSAARRSSTRCCRIPPSRNAPWSASPINAGTTHRGLSRRPRRAAGRRRNQPVPAPAAPSRRLQGAEGVSLDRRDADRADRKIVPPGVAGGWVITTCVVRDVALGRPRTISLLWRCQPKTTETS